MKYFLIIATLLLFGCKVTEEKARNYYLDNKGKLSKLCLECFDDQKEPEHSKGDTIVVLDSIISIDTVKVSVIADCPDGAKVFVDCPPTKVIERIKYSHITDTIYKDRWQTKAHIEIIESENLKLKTDILNKDKIINSWKKIALFSLGFIGVYLLIVSIRKKLY